MFRNIRQFAPLSGVAVNALANGKIPAAGTHYTYMLRFLTSGGALVTQAQMIADATLVRIKVDGETFVEGSSEFLYKLSDYYYTNRGLANSATAGQLAINLSRDFMFDDDQASVFAWGTADVNDITVEVQLNSSLTTAQIQVYVDLTDAVEKLGTHCKILRFARTLSSAAEDTIDNLPKDPRSIHLAYHIFFDDATADLNDVKLTVEGTDVLNLTTDTVWTVTAKAGRTRQINGSGNSIFPIDMNLINNLKAGLPIFNPLSKKVIGDLRIRPTFSGAAPGAYYTYMEVASERP